MKKSSKYKWLAFVNISGVVILLTLAFVASVADTVGILLICAVVAVFDLIFLIVANLCLLRYKSSPTDQLRALGNKGNFQKYTKRIILQYESVESRREFFETETNESMQDLYKKIHEQAVSNIQSAVGYISSYDFCTQPEPVYLQELCQKGDIMVTKFNKLVEQVVDIDTNLTELDSAYIDDVLESMEEIKKL